MISIKPPCWLLTDILTVGWVVVVSYQTTSQHWYRNNKNATGNGASALVLKTCAKGLHAWRWIFLNWCHLCFESVISPHCMLVPSIVQLEFCTGHRRVLIQDAREEVTMIPAKLAVHWHGLCTQWRIYCLDTQNIWQKCNRDYENDQINCCEGIQSERTILILFTPCLHGTCSCSQASKYTCHSTWNCCHGFHGLMY